MDVELTEVSERRVTSRLENFSIVFRGPVEPVLPQRIYRLEHAQMLEFDLFLVPIGRDGQGVYYEAVFNRLIEST